MENIECKNCGARGFIFYGNYASCRFCGSKFLLSDSEAVEYGVSLNPIAVDWYMKANSFRAASNSPKELDALRHAVEADESFTMAWVHLGRIYREGGMFSKAFDCYKKAQELDPDFPLAFSNEAVAYTVLGQYDKAVRGFEKALSSLSEVDPDYPTVLANYALALGKTGNKSKAVGYLKRASRLGYENTDVIRKMLGVPKALFLLAKEQ